MRRPHVPKENPVSDLLIEPAELAERLRRPDPESPLVVLDVRWTLGRDRAAHEAEYLQGHIPGAVFLDLDSALSGPVREDGTGGRHPMPSLAAATRAFREVGISDDHEIVVYDAANSVSAARAWWLLTYFGKDEVRVLDGGYAAWLRAGQEGSTQVPEVTPGDIVLTAGGRRLLDADGVEHYADRHQVVDARTPERFRGEREPVDAVAGHIPGAINIPALRNVDADGRFLPADDLELRFTALGLQGDKRTAVYCGSGVQACHLALAMEIAEVGHYDPAVYIGSWSDWITDPDRPVQTGP